MFRRTSFIEVAEYLFGGDMVVYTGCFAGGVHGPDSAAHIHARHVELSRKDIAECASSGHVAMIHEILAIHAGLSAESREDGSGVSIGHIF